ncbi:MAG: hypothetical protein IH623_02530 [Verrucomicrobia bacterium]|nr:hypothetical protein [Verrucomicrobiota bacterium]
MTAETQNWSWMLKQNGIFLAAFALLLFCMTYAHQKKFDGPTPVSRLDLLHSLLIQRTVNIDAYHKNTPDKAVFQGSYYSDKAPGTAALALVPFATAAGILWAAGVSLDSSLGWLFSSWVACAGSIGLITAFGGVALFAWLSKHVSPSWALVTTLAVFLGAAPLPYATMMFSHALVVGLLAIAVWAIHKNAEYGMRSAECKLGERRMIRRFKANRWSLLAGHACGWALASEYSSGLVVVGLFVWFVFMNNAASTMNPEVGRATPCAPGRVADNNGAHGVTRPTLMARLRAAWLSAIPFGLAAIPPLLLIPAYSWACFGNPFILPYSLQASFPAMQEGVYAIKWPNPETAFNLLFTPARGLFFWTPFFVMAGIGYWQLIQKSRGLFWLTYLVPLLHIIVISGRTWDWPAGPAWGPRLLSPMIPLLALPCAYGLQRFPWMGLPLAVYSILVTTLATLTDACPSYPTHPNPLFDLNIPLFLKGEFSPNLGTTLGLPPFVSVALFYAVLIGGFWWLWRQLPGRE